MGVFTPECAKIGRTLFDKEEPGKTQMGGVIRKNRRHQYRRNATN